MPLRRGDLYWADLNPRQGAEPGKIRPVLIVQTNRMSGHSSTIICPTTTKLVPQPHPFRLRLVQGTAGLPQDCDIMVDLICAIDNRRFLDRLGELPGPLLIEFYKKLLDVLDLL